MRSENVISAENCQQKKVWIFPGVVGIGLELKRVYLISNDRKPFLVPIGASARASGTCRESSTRQYVNKMITCQASISDYVLLVFGFIFSSNLSHFSLVLYHVT